MGGVKADWGCDFTICGAEILAKATVIFCSAGATEIGERGKKRGGATRAENLLVWVLSGISISEIAIFRCDLS